MPEDVCVWERALADVIMGWLEGRTSLDCVGVR